MLIGPARHLSKALCAELKARFLKRERVARLLSSGRFTVTPATAVANGPVSTAYPDSTWISLAGCGGTVSWSPDTCLVGVHCSLKEQVDKGDTVCHLRRWQGHPGAGQSFTTT